jgi:hypothetical protein
MLWPVRPVKDLPCCVVIEAREQGLIIGGIKRLTRPGREAMRASTAR